jgi:hypothetical protein
MFNYEKCYPKRLKKIFQSNLNMETYRSFVPNMQRAVVGNIPPEIIKMFPKETRGQNIKDFQNILADTSRYIRASYEKMRFGQNFSLLDQITYGPSQQIKEWVESTNVLFNACLRRYPDNPFVGKLEYIDHGVSAKVFKLSLMDKAGNKIMHDKALKVYHTTQFACENVATMHGNYAEANFWTYIKRAIGHNMDKTQFTKHYISDLHNGYSLTEFIDSEIPKTTKKVDFANLFRISYRDSHHNRPYYGKLYDAGGFSKNRNFMDDKIVLRYFKKLFFRSPKELPAVQAQIEALAENPKTPHRDKIQKALSLFKKE